MAVLVVLPIGNSIWIPCMPIFVREEDSHRRGSEEVKGEGEKERERGEGGMGGRAEREEWEGEWKGKEREKEEWEGELKGKGKEREWKGGREACEWK